ncbi:MULTISPECIES: LysR family transcriptional regulator [unclassified Achromobacter]|uniref:LysR family transcriptional regulator n=1 Tax=unclassified Achromobacter TaxID=2626865 RepID=UPI000B514DF2|nr:MULTISPECIES: LysR family transcriptional regulator [unclassified Achromobacter]OWT74571.1 LysR family transcriptional regulator [Achromobacter sp. HZ34]OWT79038.1 LysR family transcriptional regulator [Achromobacter sp. HZ28]
MKHPDLNLLVHFDALMTCRSVSRAAEQVGISQPAMSAALGRLRKLFNDPLLVRENTAWQPTPQGLALLQEFQPLLARWRRATGEQEEFDPRRSTRTVSLYATDYMQFTLLPRVLPGLAQDAPHIHLRVMPARLLHGMSMLDTNHVELLAGYFPDPSPNLRARFLYEEPAVCIVREQHPCLRRRWNLDAYLRYGHVDLAAHTGYFSSAIDRLLHSNNRQRTVAATLSSYMVCPYVVAASDLISTMPLSIARAAAAQTGLVLLEPPLKLPPLSVSLYWHERYQDDSGHAWLRQYIAGKVAQP